MWLWAWHDDTSSQKAMPQLDTTWYRLLMPCGIELWYSIASDVRICNGCEYGMMIPAVRRGWAKQNWFIKTQWNANLICSGNIAQHRIERCQTLAERYTEHSGTQNCGTENWETPIAEQRIAEQRIDYSATENWEMPKWDTNREIPIERCQTDVWLRAVRQTILT